MQVGEHQVSIMIHETVLDNARDSWICIFDGPLRPSRFDQAVLPIQTQPQLRKLGRSRAAALLDPKRSPSFPHELRHSIIAKLSRQSSYFQLLRRASTHTLDTLLLIGLLPALFATRLNPSHTHDRRCQFLCKNRQLQNGIVLSLKNTMKRC